MTATPGASKRLATAGNADDSQPIGPVGQHKADALTTGSNTSVSDVSADPTHPTQVTKSGDFNAGAALMDLRAGTEVITLSSFGTGDSFTITFQEADGTKVTTAAIVKATNSAASDVQTAIRAALTGTDLTVVSGNDGGPYTIVYNRFYQGRRFPKIVAVTCTNCTATYARTKTPASRLGGGHLGESLFDGDGVGPGHALTGPVTTTTPGSATNEVQTLTPGAGVDGGTVKIQFRRETSGPLAWNATIATIQAEVDAMFARMGGPISAASGTDSPVVTMTGVEVATIDLGDINTGDTYKLTYNSVESTTAIAYDTYLADHTVPLQAAVNELLGSTTAATVAKVDANTYTVTKNASGSFASTFKVTSATTFTPLGTGGYTNGGKITTDFVDASGQAVWTFTFSRGYFDGKPVRGGFRIVDNAGAGTFTDGGVADTATIAVATPGVLGSASVAYTELATYGDAVLVALVKDDTGVVYANGTNGVPLLDTDTPVVISGLPQGTYTLVARTYDTESRRLGPVSTEAVTIA
ncbi:MAG TPA: hypothetical protein VNN79_02670 [Actinomycetota bacterium]|nr:hypothetical protein [Actinomycetota bacterium]